MRSSFLNESSQPGHATGHSSNPPPGRWAPRHAIHELGKRFSQRVDRFTAYDISYGLALPAGLVLALGVVILAFQIPVSSRSDYTIVEVRQELVTLEEIQQTRQELPPPAPPRPPVPIEVANDQVLDESIELNLDASLDLDEALVDVQPPPPPPPQEEEEEEISNEIFVAVEDMPVMIGGIASLTAAIQYPEMARKAGVEGRVIVQIIIDENGIPRDPVIVRSASELLDEEAVRAVMMQRFTPGKQRGRAVKVKLAIPVMFRLRSASGD